MLRRLQQRDQAMVYSDGIVCPRSLARGRRLWKGSMPKMTSPQASPFILNLDSPQATLERVGGKGASLARMVAAGLPVPPGFHITTGAYRRYVDENHLGDRILSAAAQAQVYDPATLDRASEQIQSLIAQGAIPGDIAEMIRQW